MGILEIISAIVLIVACVFIVLVVLMQDTKQGMSQTITTIIREIQAVQTRLS